MLDLQPERAWSRARRRCATKSISRCVRCSCHLERQDVLLRVHPEVVKTLKLTNARWLNELEEMSGKTIIVKSDPTLHPEQFDIH